MKPVNRIAVIILLSFISSCSVFTKTETGGEEVFLDDGYKKTADGEVALDDISFSVNERTDIKKNTVNSPTITTKAADGSTVSEMTDSAGNKSQSRCFGNHLLVACIVLKIPVNGERKVLVYDQNGRIKTLSADKIEDIFTVSPDQAAAAAEIYEGRKNNPSPTMFSKKENDSQPLQPMPSYKFPVQQPMPQQIQPTAENEQTEKSAEKSNETPSEVKDGKIQEDGMMTQNQPSDRQKEN